MITPCDALGVVIDHETVASSSLSPSPRILSPDEAVAMQSFVHQHSLKNKSPEYLFGCHLPVFGDGDALESSADS